MPIRGPNLPFLDTRYVNVTGDTMTGELVVEKTATEALLVRKDADAGDVFVVDTTNRKIVVTSETSGQSIIGSGLIINNDAGNADQDDFQVKGNTVAQLIFADVSAGTVGIGGVLTMGADILSDIDSTDDLGSSTIYWANTYTDKIYLDADSTIINTDIDAWNAHLTSDGSDHTFIDQSVVSGSTPTFTATNITGVPAASILAGTFGTGAYVFDNTVSGITTLTATTITDGTTSLTGGTMDAVLFTDKIKFTQTDGNEYIDSLADGYMDYRATTAHRFGDGTNQTNIASNGTMTFDGTARFWQGIFLDVARFKEPTANTATLVNRGIGKAYSFTKNQDDEHLHIQVSMPGFWDTTEDLEVILHWDSPAISGDCYWEVRYQLLAEDEVMDATTFDGTEGDVFTSSGTSKGLIHSTITIPTADFDVGDKKLRFALYRMGDNAGDTIEDFIYLHGIRVRGVRYKTGGAVT